MIKSMTGYGKREGAHSAGSVMVEVRSVNHRFCEVQVRLPRFLADMEERIKKTVQRRCARGRVDVTVSVGGSVEGERVLRLDRSLVRQYDRLLRELQRELKLQGSVDLALLAGFRDIISVAERGIATEPVKRLVERLTAGALMELDAMRRREGAQLARDIGARLREIQYEVGLIEVRAPEIARGHFQRMKVRVAALLETGSADAGRLSTELAVYADRSDVTEEITRLRSHLVQFDRALRKKDPVGRTLDFLLQEMGREINTVGSKANDADVASRVVQIKGELEKIREQVQNIE